MREQMDTLATLKHARAWIAQTSLDGGRPDGMNAISRNRPKGFDMGHLDDAIAALEQGTGASVAPGGSFVLFGYVFRWSRVSSGPFRILTVGYARIQRHER